MGEGVLDLKQQLKALKAGERVAAFTGFTVPLGQGRPDKDGALKVAEHVRQDGSGYLTLTFQTDLDMEEADKAALLGLFRRFAVYASKADPTMAAARFGQGYEYMMLIDDGAMAGDRWFMVEINLYYKNLRGRIREIMEGRVTPALAELLPARFEGLHWWEED